MSIKITIITINYNNLEGLKKTIPSVLGQTYSNIEYILIDGGSTDGSREYLEQFTDRFTYWVSETDAGIYNAQNKGLKQATGDFILMLNSGDFLADHTVLEQVVLQIKPDARIVGCDLYNDYGKKRLTKRAADQLSVGFFLTRTIYHSSVLIARNVHEQFGFYNEELRIVADWEFLLLTGGIHQCTYQHVPVFLTVFDTTGISSDNKYWQLQDQERREVCRRLLPGGIYEEIRALQYYLEYRNLDFFTFKKKSIQSRAKYMSLKQIIKTRSRSAGLLQIFVYPVSFSYKRLAFKIWLRRFFV